MKKFLLGAIAAVAVFFGSANHVAAQAPGQLPTLPLDSALRTGTLDNGLTYFIRHNDNPKGQADFYIAQKVGSILEEDNQRGLAHFLEHMCFNGTENFPGKNLINWLESIGVKFGYNLNAYTGVDETVYNISNVPVARTSVQDSCLLILHDWANALTLDPVEIDAERGVIHEEWRQAMKGSMRILEQALPAIYPDSKYGHRLPIGIMEVVDNFEPQALVDYYHTWYRPDQQALIVVGDIDPDYIEAKIKEMFSNIKMPENAKERVYLEVEDTPGTLYAIGQDTEMSAAVMMLMFKNDNARLPREYRNTPLFFQMEFITDMVTQMLNMRLADLAKTPECEFSSARVEVGDFFLAKTKGALSMEIVAKDDDVIPAFTQAYRELLRAARTGFTIGEYERARAEFMSHIEKAYEERNDRKNESYSREYVRFFVDNVPAPGIAYEKEQYDSFVNLVGVDIINQYLPQLVIDDNRVLIALLPEKEGFTAPTEQQFANAFESVEDEELEGYKDEMRTDPLIPALPKPGKVKKTTELSEWGATEYTLSNGVKVIVKPTDFKANEIVLSGIAKGKAGSTLDQSLASSIKYINNGLCEFGINAYNSSDIQKYTQGKQAGVTFSFDNYTRNVNGRTTVKDLPTLMELLYGYFTGITLDETEFEATRGAVTGILSNQEATPEFQFNKNLLNTLFAAPAKHMLIVDDIKAADREAIVKIVREMTANAADYTFVFVGAIDPATFVPLMEQYIATLPANAKKSSGEITLNPDFEMVKGSGTDVFTTKMQTPQTYAFIGLNGTMPYTAKNKALASVSAQILSKRLLNKIREEMGATYSIGASGSMTRAGGANVMFQIAFPMKPEMREEALQAISDIIESMKDNVTEDELKPVIEYSVKQAGEDLKENSDWAGSITATQINGVQTFVNTVETLESITLADVKAFMADILKQNNYRVILLNPEGVEEAAK